ncbi:MAG: RsiV family protein [Planctomycetota bacterium]|jgi:hypothetical protein|nr:RsiV family protein [Planctomycetota bacterium]
MKTQNAFFAAALVLVTAFRIADAGEPVVETRDIAYSWSIDGGYPHTGIPAVDEKLTDWLVNLVKATMAEAAESYLPDLGYEGHVQSYEANLRHAVTRPGPEVVSVVFFAWRHYSLQAHPMTDITTVNLRLCGDELTLDDMFDDPEAALRIIAKESESTLRKKVREERPECFEDGESDAFLADGFEPARDNYENLGLEPDGVRVYFPLYQVLPYALGIRNVSVTLDKLAPAGPRKDIWPKAG